MLYNGINETKHKKGDIDMKAKQARIVEPGRFEIFETEIPKLEPNQVLVKMVSAGLCHSDVPPFNGIGEQGDDPRGFAAMIPVQYPSLIGHEPVGIVLDVGSDIKHLKANDWVTGMLKGCFADIAVGFGDRLVKIPEGTRNMRYCLGEPMMCITNILRIASPEFMDNVAVVGCGMMGLLTISGLKARNLKNLIAIDLDDDRLEQAKKYGATVTINPRTEDVMDRILEITSGKGVDVSVELSGSLKGLETAVKIARFAGMLDHKGRGKVLMSTLYGKEEKWSPSLGFDLMFRGVVLHSAHPRYAQDLMENMQRAVDAYCEGILPIDDMITHEYKLEQINEGFHMMMKPDKSYLKGIITFD